jgi:hypothetical protein
MPAPSPAGDDMLHGDFDASLEQPGVRRHAHVMRRPSLQGAAAALFCRNQDGSLAMGSVAKRRMQWALYILI